MIRYLAGEASSIRQAKAQGNKVAFFAYSPIICTSELIEAEAMQLRIICAISFTALMLSQLPAQADEDVKVVCFPVSGNSTTPGTIHGPGGSFKVINIDAFKAAFEDADMLNLDNERNKLMLQGLLQDRDIALTSRLSETDVKNAEQLTAIDVKRNNDRLKKIMSDFSGVKGADLVIERSLKNLTSDLKQLENN